MLTIRNLRKAFDEPDGGKLEVLDVPEFDLAAGQQRVIRGQSGCGKTTLLHAIAGLTTVDAGSIKLSNVAITDLGEASRDRFRAMHIGYVFQTFNLLAGFSALENVQLGMSFTGNGVDVARAEELLKQVGVAHRMTHKPSALSVGEQQRVSVARALANKPLLMLADEPTANVDPAHQQQVIDLIRQSCEKENIALLLVTHADEVAQQFDDVVQLQDINQVAA